MRKIERIIVHCSATIEGANIKTNTIRRWHVKGNKWKDIGYHYVVELDGKVGKGREEKTIGAHTKSKNSTSIGVCYIGGLDQEKQPKDTLRGVQLGSMEQLLMDLLARYPEATLHGHNEFSKKACPSFNVQEKFERIIP